MLVSIVIPVYNGANYLREALDSAFAQTHPDIEVLVVNDGSSDDTEAIARSYGDRIRYFAKENGGVSSALNVGIREMRGEWFSWLSHDDLFLRHKTAAQLRYAETHAGAKVVCCNFERMDASGAFLSSPVRPEAVHASGLEFLRNYVFFGTMLVHREVFAKTGPFDESNQTTQDTEMCMRILEHEPMYRMPDVLCRVRVHPESTSSTAVERHQRDRERMWSQFAERYDAAFFDRQHAATPQQRARTYLRVAERADLFRLRAARIFALRSLREWPSIRNRAWWRVLLGARLYRSRRG